VAVIVQLRTPTRDECQLVRTWRNAPDVLPMLRTGVKTEAEQDDFYRHCVINPQSPHRYYALTGLIDQGFLGLGGLTYITCGEGEISLILAPGLRHIGLGRFAVDALLAEAFGPLGLRRVLGECYATNPAWTFWERQLARTDCDVFAWLDEKTDSLHWRWTKRSA
jgi:RimJ/RimL family protein N-acetyltransferase